MTVGFSVSLIFNEQDSYSLSNYIFPNAQKHPDGLILAGSI